MKTLKLFGLLIAGACVVQACSSPENRTVDTDTSISTTTMTESTTGAGMDSTVSNFMTKAAIGGMMEVEAGKLAEKSANPKVKAFGEEMVKDHTKANDELKALANKKQVSVPMMLPSEENAHLDAMKKMKGADFDKHYVEMMVTDHDKTIALFKTAANSTDVDVKDFANKTIPVITGHFEQAKSIQNGMK